VGRKDQGDEEALREMEEEAVEVEELARQETPPSTPPGIISDKTDSSLLLESPGWGTLPFHPVHPAHRCRRLQARTVLVV
jgi:hypothetical protein